MDTKIVSIKETETAMSIAGDGSIPTPQTTPQTNHVTLPVLLLLVGLAIFSTHCPKYLVKPSTNFAQTLNTGADVMRPVAQDLYEVCILRARIYQFQAIGRQSISAVELLEPFKQPAHFESSSESTSNSERTAKSETCREYLQTEKYLGRLLTVLSEYGRLLRALAEASDYDGGNIEDLTKNVADLAEKINSDDKTITMLKDTAGPLKTLASAVMTAYTHDKLKEGIISGHAPLISILDALKNYGEALALQAKDAERNELPVRLASLSGASRTELLVLHHNLSTIAKVLQQKRSRGENLQKAAEELKKSHIKLKKLAEEGPSDQETLDVLNHLMTALEALEDFKNTAALIK